MKTTSNVKENASANACVCIFTDSHDSYESANPSKENDCFLNFLHLHFHMRVARVSQPFSEPDYIYIWYIVNVISERGCMCVNIN